MIQPPRETTGAALPTAIYGGVLLVGATAYFILQTILVRLHGAGSDFVGALTNDLKGRDAHPSLIRSGSRSRS